MYKYKVSGHRKFEILPSNVSFGSSGFSRSKIRSSLSLEAVARETESLEKLTDLTMCLCCKLSNSSPSTAFQTLAEKSAAPLAVMRINNPNQNQNRVRN